MCLACACAGFAEVHLPLLHGTLWVGCAYLRVEGSHGKESPWQHPGLCRLSFLLCLGESSSITVSPLLTPRKVLLKQPATAHHCCHLPLDLSDFSKGSVQFCVNRGGQSSLLMTSWLSFGVPSPLGDHVSGLRVINSCCLAAETGLTLSEAQGDGAPMCPSSGLVSKDDD